VRTFPVKTLLRSGAPNGTWTLRVGDQRQPGCGQIETAGACSSEKLPGRIPVDWKRPVRPGRFRYSGTAIPEPPSSRGSPQLGRPASSAAPSPHSITCTPGLRRHSESSRHRRSVRPSGGLIGHQVSAALGAGTAGPHGVFLESADELALPLVTFTFVGFPQRGKHSPAPPTTIARACNGSTHSLGRATHFDLHGSTEASPSLCLSLISSPSMCIGHTGSDAVYRHNGEDTRSAGRWVPARAADDSRTRAEYASPLRIYRPKLYQHHS